MDRQGAEKLAGACAALARRIGRPVRLMEVCGTHTVALFRHGVRSLLPAGVTLLSGPGCPVCVTSVRDVDVAIAVAFEPGTELVTFGDMMRVPGSSKNLLEARSEGARVSVAYSPNDALVLARENPDTRYVFFATGFETTSPLVAATVMMAHREGIENFFIYPVHKLVPPALKALLSAGDSAVDGFMMPGHVCSISGTVPYEFLASDHGVPAVVAGFDASDMLTSIAMLLEMIASGKPEVKIQYTSVVKPGGNPKAVSVLDEVFEPSDAYWRGIGTIPMSGLRLRDRYRRFDITNSIESLKDIPEGREPRGCSCGEVLKGLKVPTDCPLFGKACTPEKPVGACMVSAEGSCAAYYKYGGHGG